MQLIHSLQMEGFYGSEDNKSPFCVSVGGCVCVGVYVRRHLYCVFVCSLLEADRQPI